MGEPLPAPAVPAPAVRRTASTSRRVASAIGPTGANAALEMVRRILEYRGVLVATTRLELAKRYAGSALGTFWVVLQPTLFLAIYLFTYAVIFRVRLPGLSRLEYVLFVFAALAPYLGFMEAVTSGCLVIRQNLHLIKNVMIPIELIPVRGVLVSMASQMVSLVAVLVLSIAVGRFTLHWLWVPVLVILEVMMLWGVVWVLSAITVVVPDVAYFTNLAVTMLMFVSPIGFSVDMVPAPLRLMVYFNPVYYLIENYRAAIFQGHLPGLRLGIVFVVLSLVAFVGGAAFFRRFKDVLVDYE